eukprot:GEMP01001928.1.p1 GENE.GEMP01001928.1~~GEMP01001928.1.p1  ORF type:complete len:1064 (+),score=207.46 GEMP01001928.1:48-3194(+)
MSQPRNDRHATSKAPAVVGDYTIGATVGEGTFGKVKLGTHERTGGKVAIKILEKAKVESYPDVERVIRELQILKFLRHPHIIHLYEIIENPKRLYLIMEYANGGELFTYISKKGRIDEREAVKLFRQIISGVEKIHMMNVVHRDLKPENLLLDAWNNVKIIDFGLSNRFQAHQLLKTACGSPCYAPPEMIQGKEYIPQLCDVWSCGVILFAIICGYLPFEDAKTSELYRKIEAGDYRCANHVSLDAEDLISSMLTPDPSRRTSIRRIRFHRWFQGLHIASDLDSRPIDIRFTDFGCGVPACQLCRHWYRPGCGDELDDEIIGELKNMGFDIDFAQDCLKRNKRNQVTASYYLLLERKTRMAYERQRPFDQFNLSQGSTQSMRHRVYSGSDIKIDKQRIASRREREDRAHRVEREEWERRVAQQQAVVDVPRPLNQRDHCRGTSSGSQRVPQTARLPSRHDEVRSMLPRLALPNNDIDDIQHTEGAHSSQPQSTANWQADKLPKSSRVPQSQGRFSMFDAMPASARTAVKVMTPRVTCMELDARSSAPTASSLPAQPVVGSTWIPETPRDPALLTHRGSPLYSARTRATSMGAARDTSGPTARSVAFKKHNTVNNMTTSPASIHHNRSPTPITAYSLHHDRSSTPTTAYTPAMAPTSETEVQSSELGGVRREYNGATPVQLQSREPSCSASQSMRTTTATLGERQLGGEMAVFGPSLVERCRPVSPRDPLAGAGMGSGASSAARDSTPQRNITANTSTTVQRTVVEPTGELNTRTVLGPITNTTNQSPTFPSTYVPLSARGDRVMQPMSYGRSGMMLGSTTPTGTYAAGTSQTRGYSAGTPTTGSYLGGAPHGGSNSHGALKGGPYLFGKPQASSYSAVGGMDPNRTNGPVGSDMNRGKSTSILEGAAKLPPTPTLRTSQSQKLPDLPVNGPTLSHQLGHGPPPLMSHMVTGVGPSMSNVRASSVNYPGPSAQSSPVYRMPSVGATPTSAKGGVHATQYFGSPGSCASRSRQCTAMPLAGGAPVRNLSGTPMRNFALRRVTQHPSATGH